MKNIVVRPGDTLSKLILLEYEKENTIDRALLNCLVKYIGYINGYNLDLLDNINSGDYSLDPDSLQPGKVLMFPNTLEEAFADRVFNFVYEGSCKQYYKPIEVFQVNQSKKSNSISALKSISGLLKDEISEEQFREILKDLHR